MNCPVSLAARRLRMSWIGVMLALAAVVGGFVLTMTVGSLGGMLLIIGGVGALGVMALPGAIDFSARWLSTGRPRRR
jgi:hypothetical protein